MTRFRWIILSVLLIVVALVGGTAAFFLLYKEKDTTAPHLEHYAEDQRQDDAQYILGGLNTHDVAKVDVLRGLSKDDPIAIASTKAQYDTVLAALPAAGCQYALKSVDDRGEQGKKVVPGMTKEDRVYRLDLNVDEQCPGQPRHARTLGLYLVPYWGYWTPLSFVD